MIFRLSVLLLIISVVFLCTSQITGTSEVGNPERVAGTIVDVQNGGVSGISIVMVRNDYVPEQKNLSKQQQPYPDSSYYSATTDNSGNFQITVRHGETYNLIASDTANSSFAMVQNLRIDSLTDLDTLRLLLAKAVTVYAKTSEANSYLAVTGTLFSAPVISDSVTLSLPQNCELPKMYARENKQLIDSSLIAVMVPGVSGSFSNKDNIPIITVTILNAEPSLYEYRFTITSEDTSYTSGWYNGSPVTFTPPSPGIYTIKSQARKAGTEDYVSSWSSPVQTDAKLTISTPHKATGPDTVIIGKEYTYQIGGAVCNFPSTIEYQWKRDDTFDEVWSEDTITTQIWTIEGQHKIKAMARCNYKNRFTAESGWPDYLIIFAKQQE